VFCRVVSTGRQLVDEERRLRVEALRTAGRDSALPGLGMGGGAASAGGGLGGGGGGGAGAVEDERLLSSGLGASDDVEADDGSGGDSSEELLDKEREHKWHKRLEARRAESNRTASIERPLTDPAPSP
jgi:hypothetical protein